MGRALFSGTRTTCYMQTPTPFTPERCGAQDCVHMSAHVCTVRLGWVDRHWNHSEVLKSYWILEGTYSIGSQHSLDWNGGMERWNRRVSKSSICVCAICCPTGIVCVMYLMLHKKKEVSICCNRDGAGREQQSQPNISLRQFPRFYSCESCEASDAGEQEKEMQIKVLGSACFVGSITWIIDGSSSKVVG